MSHVPDEVLTVVVADDDLLAADGLSRLLSRDPALSIVATCYSSDSVTEAIRSMRPDVAFLDVHMPGMTGLDILKQVTRDQCRFIVLVTAFSKYAVRAFELAAFDYILKPVNSDRLANVVNRIRRQATLESQLSVQSSLGSTDSVEESPDACQRVEIVSRGSIHYVAIRDIVWIESARNLLLVHLHDRVISTRCAMSRMEQRLGRSGFIRIHRGSLVNSSWIVRVHPRSNGEAIVTLGNGTEVVASRRRRHQLREF